MTRATRERAQRSENRRLKAALSATTIRERGILFSAPLVRALLAGTKTQTRRLLKPKTKPWLNHYMEGGCQKSDWSPSLGDDSDPAMWWWTSAFAAQEPIGRCPYGVVGDRLWVRETFKILDYDCDEEPQPDDHECTQHCKQTYVYYRATPRVGLRPKPDGARITYLDESTPLTDWYERDWRPSLFMPSWASRITLEVTEVRVQRLQDISRADAIAEGIDAGEPGDPPEWPQRRFQGLWDEINGERASWASNPFVWCVSFKRVETKP